MSVCRFVSTGSFWKRVGFLFIATLFLTTIQSIAPADANPKYASIVVDHHTGRIIHSRHADAQRFPASLTKVMTLYILFDEMKAGRIKLSDRMHVSAHAAARPPSKIGVKKGRTIRVEDAINALVTKSANDVATVVAEHISGSEAAFAKRMTRKARQIGMRRTTFKNASGLPNQHQVTTARDMATMGRSIMVNHPRYYRYFKTRNFNYAGRGYRNHNRLLGQVSGVDGIKTGYTRASGFNLLSSRKTNNRHIVAVVMGGRSGRSRDAHMATLLQRHLGSAVARKSAPRVPPGTAIAAVEVPLPLERPASAPQIAVASATPAISAPTTAGQPTQVVVAMSSTSRPPAPAASAPTQATVVPSVDVPVAAPVDQPITAANSVPEAAPAEAPKTGWAIQIGAVGTNDEAQALLAKAKSKSVPAIEDRMAFTEPTVKNGETFVRARFAGFTSASQAKDACRQMKRKGFGCFAISL